jgi:ABC-type microcin C transport system permease subunit YejB
LPAAGRAAQKTTKGIKAVAQTGSPAAGRAEEKTRRFKAVAQTEFRIADLRKQQQQDRSQLNEKQKQLLKQLHKRSFELQLEYKEQMLQLRKEKLQQDISLAVEQQLLQYMQQEQIKNEENQLRVLREQLEQYE